MMAPVVVLARLGRGRRVGRVHQFIAADIGLGVEVVGVSLEFPLELLFGRTGQ